VASFDRGKKRQCLHCATKYYDLNKDPILCPNCGEVFTVTIAKAAPVAAAPVAAKPVTDEVEKDTAAAAAGAEIISLDDVEDDDDDDTDDDDDVLAGVEDVEVDDELADDETDAFLEDDEEDDAVGFTVAGDEKEDI
jgi:uncharacterized protein (TIGR02300 family)